MRRGESGEAQDRVFKRYEFSAKGKFLGRVRIWGASMGFLRVFCGALTTRLRGFCGVSLTWRVLLLFSVDVKCLFRYDRDMADHQPHRMLAHPKGLERKSLGGDKRRRYLVRAPD